MMLHTEYACWRVHLTEVPRRWPVNLNRKYSLLGALGVGVAVSLG